jgi:hypothetical protein
MSGEIEKCGVKLLGYFVMVKSTMKFEVEKQFRCHMTFLGFFSALLFKIAFFFFHIPP